MSGLPRRRNRAAKQKVRINRRPQDEFTEHVAQAAAEQAARDQRLNLKIAAFVALLSAPALIISLFSLYFQVQNDNEAGKKEAARVNWSVEWNEDKTKATAVVIENRSLNPASLTTLVLKDERGRAVQHYLFDYITPCTRETYRLPPNAIEAINEFNEPGPTSLYFVDSLGRVWRNDDSTVQEVNGFLDDEGKDIISEYDIRYETEELQACA
ncbi:hypothetical protein [Streptomyces sp. NPDC048581]|uniref:hypothetical protein n=1 Tax=unclassified Streptomyces TaxID=2593676 RepID=UPI003712AEFC